MTGLEIPMWLVLLGLAVLYMLLGLRWESSRVRGRRCYARLLNARKYGVLTTNELIEQQNGETP